MKAAVVIPTIGPERIREFLSAWAQEFRGHRVIVVEDAPCKSPLGEHEVEHYCWEDIDRELGEEAWIIPRRTDCVRSYGFYVALRSGCDMIVSLDDDCLPVAKGFLSQHFEALETPCEQTAWAKTGRGLHTRGFPYRQFTRSARCVLNHGLWKGVPDYDAMTQLLNGRLEEKFEPEVQVFQKGVYFPMCGMNVAFRPEMTPAMYFLLMGPDYQYDRFGDIWCGILVKKICDHLGYGVRSGGPEVEHRRASDAWKNLAKEVSGYEANECFWREVDAITLTQVSVADCYQEIADKLSLSGAYWEKLGAALKVWVRLCQRELEMRQTSVIEFPSTSERTLALQDRRESSRQNAGVQK